MFDSPGAYDRFMGRYSVPLAAEFIEFASTGRGDKVLDVGSGPGALTGTLIARLGAEVSAVDPSEPFVATLADRYPQVDARVASAESLPFADDTFDQVLSQLVVHFMADPVAGLREMGRVTRRGGRVAACVWDLAGGKSPISNFWTAARDLDPTLEDESWRPGTARGQLEALFQQAGLGEVEEGMLTVRVTHHTFEEWWEPFTDGVGPAGDYVARLAPDARARLADRCREILGEPPIVIEGVAWAARARSPG
jgi:SAM-dependent methyltransferase